MEAVAKVGPVELLRASGVVRYESLADAGDVGACRTSTKARTEADTLPLLKETTSRDDHSEAILSEYGALTAIKLCSGCSVRKCRPDGRQDV
jgi:hypothetical protein